MERVNQIRNHPLYQEHMQKILKLEQDRIFCGHGPEHLLDVARLAWIMNLVTIVTVLLPGFLIPLMVMQVCSPSTITITP